MKFSDRLKELRIDKGMSQKELGDFLSVHKTTISHWENKDKSQRFPDEDILNKLADFFNCTMDYLMGRTNLKNTQIITKEINGHKFEFEVENPEDLLDLMGNEDKYGITKDESKQITDGILEVLHKAGVLKK